MLVRRKFIQLSSVLLMFALVVVYFLSVLTSRRDSFEYDPREVSIGSPDEKKVVTMAVDYGAHEVVLQSSSLSTNGEGVGRRLSNGLRNKMNLRHLQPTHDAGVIMGTVDYSTRQVMLEPSQLSPLSTQSKVEGEVADALHNVNHIQSDPAHDKQSSGRESRLVVWNEDSTLQSAAQTTQLLPNSVHNEVQPTQPTAAVDTWNVKYLSLVQKKGGVLQSTVQKTQRLSAPVQKELPSSTTNGAWHPHKTRRLHLSDYTSTKPTPPTTTAKATLLTTSLKASDSPRVQQSSFCFGKFCVNAVESSDRQRMFDCLRKALEYVRSLGYSHRYALNKMQCSCKLMNGSGRKRFGLVSLPGSGNTWVRGLLEKATGVCTGSMWCDRTLRSAYFCGEGMRGKSLLLVKNHDASIHWNGENGGGERQSRKVPYDAVIFLHRNPFDAIVAEWNRAAFDKYQNASAGSNMHTARYGPDMFGDNPEWNRMVLNQTSKWMLMMEHYVIDPGDHPVLVVRFEDLKKDAVTEVKKMLDFLEFPYLELELKERVQDGYTQFLRSHKDRFDHYTKEQTAHINKAIRTVIKRLQENNIMDSIGLPLYLRT